MKTQRNQKTFHLFRNSSQSYSQWEIAVFSRWFLSVPGSPPRRRFTELSGSPEATEHLETRLSAAPGQNITLKDSTLTFKNMNTNAASHHRYKRVWVFSWIFRLGVKRPLLRKMYIQMFTNRFTLLEFNIFCESLSLCVLCLIIWEALWSSIVCLSFTLNCFPLCETRRW